MLKRCAFGFNCALMLQMPMLTVEDCPNRDICGIISELTPDEQIAIQRIQAAELETLYIDKLRAGILLLQLRGCPQSLESLGIISITRSLAAQFNELQFILNSFQEEYLPPPGCEVHSYSVKRPTGTFRYNKLTADNPIFEPSQRVDKVRTIHLGRDDDPRYVVAKAGIHKRNTILQAVRGLRQVQRLLSDILASLQR